MFISKHLVSHDGMQIDVIRYEPLNILCFRPFKFFFQQLHLFYSCEVVSSSDMRKNEARPLRIHNGGRYETLNDLLYVVAKCSHFVVLYEIK